MFAIDLTGAFRERIRRLPKPMRREVAKAIDGLAGGFGHPHRHSGLGIRKLGRNYFECRSGLDLRLVFQAEPGLLTFTFAGDHDEVTRYAKGKW